MGAARHWARGAPAVADEDAQVAALAAVGVPEAEARRTLAEQWDPAEPARGAAGVFAVLPCNWEAVCVMAALPPSAWDVPPLGGKVRGLRRDQVSHELLLRGVRRRAWPALWERIRVMERVALEEWGRRG